MVEINLFRNEGDQRELRAGEELFAKGDAANEFYAVLSGTIDVVVEGDVVEQVGPGGVLGEMGILGEGVRTASAACSEAATVAVIDEDRFLRLVKLNPYFALEMMRLLAGRLEAETQRKS